MKKWPSGQRVRNTCEILSRVMVVDEVDLLLRLAGGLESQAITSNHKQSVRNDLKVHTPAVTRNGGVLVYTDSPAVQRRRKAPIRAHIRQAPIACAIPTGEETGRLQIMIRGLGRVQRRLRAAAVVQRPHEGAVITKNLSRKTDILTCATKQLQIATCGLESYRCSSDSSPRQRCHSITVAMRSRPLPCAAL